jgi:hypothetical protein
MRSGLPLIGLTLALSLGGCVSTGQTLDQVKLLIQQGRCNDARQVAEHYFNVNMGRRYTVIGAVYAECDHRNDLAYRYWTMAARYGEVGARDLLLKAGQPIPAADLAPAPAPIAPVPVVVQQPTAPAPSGVSCTSRRVGNTVQTDCY